MVVVMPPLHHRQVFKRQRMIDYMKEVNDYGRSLPPVDKQVARDVFSRLLEAGYDYEWLYFAIQNLGVRSIISHRGLFFYKPFQEEVDAMVAANREVEEQRRQHSARICAAIEQQILQRQQQNVVQVNVSKNKQQRKSAAEMLAEIMAEIEQMEDE